MTNPQQKKGKSLQIIRLSLFPDDMILYIGNLKDTTRKLLELIYTENLLHSYTLTMKDQKDKLKKQSHLLLHEKE